MDFGRAQKKKFATSSGFMHHLTNSIATAASRRRCRRHRRCRCCCLRRRRCRRRWESKKRRQKRALGVEGRARVIRRAANGDDGPCIATKTWFQFSRSDGLWIHGLRKKKRCVFLRGADGWMDFGRAQKNNVRSADFFFAGPLAGGHARRPRRPHRVRGRRATMRAAHACF